MTATTASPEYIPARVVTLNVRYATKNPVPGEEPWSVRCPKVCAQLRFIAAGQSSVFFCLQEALYSQVSDIQAGLARLGSSWGYIGHGRDDGKKAGEFSPIFYRTDNWTCERNETRWLSTTPKVPSKSWDATLNRIVTLGFFRHKETGAPVAVMSTHLDHAGSDARHQSACSLRNLAQQWGAAQVPLFLGGDFNSTPDEAPYKTLTAPNLGMKDVSGLVKENLKYGNQEITYTTFGEPGERPKRIDYLFAHESCGVKYLGFAILPNRFDDNVYLTDHRPVIVDVEIPTRPGSSL
ncbi:Endonuclease/exonuclease/phosphatase [Apodospora peruviana]|uniref:Endonuclease/exonuclease/phosphatase n=1 Tax=Apodospora peruviana TaxID=516989 RepID=A0AAE0MBX0_9PEZI|nr:Endonuclease/exonuclease/phosphatase [Apodospora peruviana]